MIKQKQWMLAAILTLLCGLNVLTSCNKSDDYYYATPAKKEYFQSWNKCESLTALQEYVEDVTNPKSANYISVEDRIATFDMDGTFVGELYPTYFEYNMLEYRVLTTLHTRTRLLRMFAWQHRRFGILYDTEKRFPIIST